MERDWLRGSEPLVRRTTSIGAARRVLHRRRFLQLAGVLLGGGMMTVAVRSTPLPALAQNQQELDVVLVALTLANLDQQFFRRALDSGKLTESRDHEVVTEVVSLAEAQRQILLDAVEALGASFEEPQFAFPADFFADRDAIMSRGAEFEELWVGGCRDIFGAARNPEALALLAAIQGVKSRKAAVLAALAGGDPFPRSIEQTIPTAQVLNDVAPYRGQA